MINYYLYTNQINLDIIIEHIQDLSFLIKINHLPTLILIYINLSIIDKADSKFNLTTSNDYVASNGYFGIVDVRCKKTNKFLYSIDLKLCPELGTIIEGLDENNVLILYHNFTTFFILLKNNTYEIVNYFSECGSNYCVKSRYYFIYDPYFVSKARVYDFVTNTNYYSEICEIKYVKNDLLDLMNILKSKLTL